MSFLLLLVTYTFNMLPCLYDTKINIEQPIEICLQDVRIIIVSAITYQATLFTVIIYCKTLFACVKYLKRLVY